MRRVAFGVMAALLLLLDAQAAAAQVAVDTTGPVKLWLTGRGQFQFNTTTIDGEPYSTFETRRVRLGAEVEIDGWIEGMVEADFAQGSLAVKDAWIDLGFHPSFRVQAGQFKKPFSRLELFSSSRIFPIERGVRLRGADVMAEHHALLDENLYLSREIGAQVHGALGPVDYAVGVFNGTGADERDENDAKSYAGRLNLRPSSAVPFEIGAAVSHRETVDPLDPNESLSGTAFEADVLWGGFRHPGLNLMAEFMIGDNILLDERMMGAQGILTWFAPTGRTRIEGIEPLVRLSWGDPNTELDDDAGILLTPGINVYFHGRNRFMLNWDLFALQPDYELFAVGGGVGSANSVRAQLNVYF